MELKHLIIGILMLSSGIFYYQITGDVVGVTTGEIVSRVIDGDTFELASGRLRQVLDLGVTPFAMLWRGETGATTVEWRQFQRQWARPAIIHKRR